MEKYPKKVTKTPQTQKFDFLLILAFSPGFPARNLTGRSDSRLFGGCWETWDSEKSSFFGLCGGPRVLERSPFLVIFSKSPGFPA